MGEKIKDIRPIIEAEFGWAKKLKLIRLHYASKPSDKEVVPYRLASTSALTGVYVHIVIRSATSLDKLKSFISTDFKLSKFFFSKINTKHNISIKKWSEYLDVPESRIRSKISFNHEQSILILSIAILYNKGVDVFGSNAKFEKWLNTKNEYYIDSTPSRFLETETGISILIDDLVKIEYGFVA